MDGSGEGWREGRRSRGDLPGQPRGRVPSWGSPRVHPALWLCSEQGAAAPGMWLPRLQGRWHRVATATSLVSPSLCLGPASQRCLSQSKMGARREVVSWLGSQQAPSADSCPGQAPTPPLHTHFARCPRCLLSPLTQNLHWKKYPVPKCILLPREAGHAGGKSGAWPTGQHKNPEPPPHPPAAGPLEHFATHIYK